MAIHHKPGKGAHPPPEGRIRSSQAVTTYGPGAMVDLLHHAVIIGGLPFWNYESTTVANHVVTEPRLRDLLVRRIRAIAPEASLSLDAPFRLPPAGDDQELTRQCGVRVFEFPRWFVCQACHALSGREVLEYSETKHHYTHRCDRGTGRATPVRFVMACPHGHLQDVDWKWFAHRGPSCASPSLFLREGRSRDFSDIKVACEGCHPPSIRMLADLYNREAGPPCRGEQPWLGKGARATECKQQLSLLIRTASNAYFAQVVSALSIPEARNEIRDAVISVLPSLEATVDAVSLGYARRVEKVKKALADHGDAEVLSALGAVRSHEEVERAPLRTAEYVRLLAEPFEAPGDLPPPDRDFFARAVDPRTAGGLPAGVRRLVRIHRLREVLVQVGFTRLEAPTADLQGEYDLGVKTAPLARAAEWLPAAEIHGEGLFLQLAPDAVREWEGRASVIARSVELGAGYRLWARGKESVPFPGVRYYLLHSLSHFLVTALSIECGYSASALSERIYCDLPGAGGEPMAGILIKTGTPGSEGTLGGLVEEGRRLPLHLRRAYDLGTLCAHDPVCASHRPTDLEERFLDGAACHGCLYIAESSCERFNRQLDRALVFPVMGCPPDLAFFRERP